MVKNDEKLRIAKIIPINEGDKPEKKDDERGYRIKRDTIIVEVTTNYPQLVEDFLELGLHCIGCPASGYESVEEGCMAHGMNDVQIDEFVERLNKKIDDIEKSKS